MTTLTSFTLISLLFSSTVAMGSDLATKDQAMEPEASEAIRIQRDPTESPSQLPEPTPVTQGEVLYERATPTAIEQYFQPIFVGAETLDPTERSIGGLMPGLLPTQVIERLGEPTSRTVPSVNEATGDQTTQWRYDAQGIELTFSSNERIGREWRVLSVAVTPPFPGLTPRGIAIGSSPEQVVAAYGPARATDAPVNEGWFAAGSISDGILFNYAHGVVAHIFIGSRSE